MAHDIDKITQTSTAIGTIAEVAGKHRDETTAQAKEDRRIIGELKTEKQASVGEAIDNHEHFRVTPQAKNALIDISGQPFDQVTALVPAHEALKLGRITKSQEYLTTLGVEELTGHLQTEKSSFVSRVTKPINPNNIDTVMSDVETHGAPSVKGGAVERLYKQKLTQADGPTGHPR